MLNRIISKWVTRFQQEEPPSSGTAHGIQWLVLIRLGVLYALLCVLVLQQVFGVSHTERSTTAYGLLSAGFAFNLIYSLLFIRLSGSHWMTFVHVVFDAGLITAWVANGGSLLVLLYLVQILAVSLTLFQRGALTASVVASAAYGLATYWLKGVGIQEWSIYSVLFIVLGLVGGYLSEELRRTGERLKEKSRDLEKITALHERILQKMPTGLLTIDKNMRIGFINPAGETILGKLLRESVGRHLGEVEPGLLPFFTQIERVEVDEEEGEVALSSTGTEHHRSAFMEPKAHRGHARLQQTVEYGRGASLKILRGDVAELDPDAGIGKLLEARHVGGRVLLFQDVTKLIHLEDKLKQNEKLAAVGQLAAGIAHEIRNPLASVSGSIEMLRRSSEIKDPENQKLMGIAIREIDRLNDLITEFLDFVKPEKLKFGPVILSKMIYEVVSGARAQLGTRTDLQIIENLASDAVAVASPEKLRQVVWNLVLNAIQAMKHEGKIQVGCRIVSEQRVSFWVQDEGTGMSEEVLSHLYEPFFTTKDRGTGLGLATSYKIIEAHHGEIKVESRVGSGTKFEVFLPRA